MEHLRYNEILHEFIIKLDNNLIVHRNPLKPVIHNLINKSHDNESRGLAVKGKIYVWDAKDGIHSSVFHLLNMEGFIEANEYSSFYLKNGIDGIYYTSFYNYLYDKGINKRLYNQESLIGYGNRNELSKHIQRWNS